MSTTNTRSRLAIISAFSVLASAPALWAADSAAAADSLELEEVMVTSERVVKDLQKVSQVINVTSGKDLKKEGKIRLDEILSGQTGILLQSDQVDTNIYMRGVTSGVPLLIDGVSQAPQGGSGLLGPAVRGTTLDVAQVEIARGVQNGAGVTSLTGIVSLSTNKPAFEYQASGSLSAGSFSLRNIEGVLNMPVGENQAVRIAYSAERRKGYISADAGNSDNRQFRVRYRWQPSDQLDIVASFQENRVEGNGVNNATLLYTGQWIDYSAGQALAWTNPYTGASSTWGPNQAAANRISVSGLVTANNVNIPGISPTNTALTTANQFYYSAGPCNVNPLASPAVGTAPGAVNTFAQLGPVITTMGCPFRQLAIRDGSTFMNRADPWDDGFRPFQWANSPVRNTLQRQFNIIIDWNTKLGLASIQPAFVYNRNYFVEPPRGASWMEQGFIPSKSVRLDAQLAANPGTKLHWVAGLNGNYNLQPPDGTGFLSVSSPGTGWTQGVVGMNATATAVNTNCYTVLSTGAATAGVANANQCLAPNYNAGNKNYNYGLSFQASYPLLEDKLRLNGSVRADRYVAQARNNGITTLIDGNGQRYLWVTPATTYAVSSVANPNSLLQVPYRMLLSQRDMDAMVNIYDLRRKSNTASFTFNAEYDFVPNAMAYVKFGTGATGAMAAAMGGATGAAINIPLPDARYPAFAGNASAAALALAGTPYVVASTLPSPLVDGEQTQQVSLGLKSRWFDDRLQVNVEAFDNQYTNRPLGQLLSGLYGFASTVTGAPTCTATATIPIYTVLGADLNSSCFAANTGSYTGDMRSSGVDLDVNWVPTASDRLDLQLSFLKTTFDGVPDVGSLSAQQLVGLSQGGNNATVAQTFADNYNSFLAGIDGQTLQNAPALSINASYQHRFRLPGGASVIPQLRYYYKSDVYFSESLMNGNNANITESNWAIDNNRWLPSVQSAHSLWDFYFSYEPADGRWSLTGYVRNVANKATLQSTSALQTISTGSVATNDLARTVVGGYANLNAPRTIGVTVSANLDGIGASRR